MNHQCLQFAGLDPSDPLNNADVHPVYGPLPNPPPPTSSQGVLKQSHHIPHPYQSHTYSSQQNVSQPTGAESLTLQGYGNHGNSSQLQSDIGSGKAWYQPFAIIIYTANYYPLKIGNHNTYMYVVNCCKLFIKLIIIYQSNIFQYWPSLQY